MAAISFLIFNSLHPHLIQLRLLELPPLVPLAYVLGGWCPDY